MAENQTPMTETNNTNELAVRREKLAALTAAGKNPFELTSFDVNAHSEAIKADFDAYEGKDVQIAGRIVGKRVMGKASFMHLLDRDGKIQVYVKRDDIGTDEYADFKKYDIGDIVGVTGFVFRTQTGEVSVHAKAIVLLSKSLLPLPEKFHGLKDQDLRYRQRYVDLIVNPEVKRNFVIRSQFIKFLRNYLDNMNYIEVETPVLNTIAGGAAARPFVTHHNTLDIDMYMRIATELPLKRLIVGGMDRVPTDNELQGGILVQGVASIVGAFFGALPTASYSQNVGIVTMNKVVNRVIFAVSAAVLLIAGLIPGLSAALTTIPQCVIGGATLSVFAQIAMTGVRLFTKDGMTARKTTVVGMSVALGVGITQVSGCLQGPGIPAWTNTVFGSSSVVVATIMAIILNLTLPPEE